MFARDERAATVEGVKSPIAETWPFDPDHSVRAAALAHHPIPSHHPFDRPLRPIGH
jgi:hypothetical protein